MDPIPLPEDSSPENRELEGVIRRLGGLLQSDAPVDWQESRRWCGEVLALLTQEPANVRLASQLRVNPAEEEITTALARYGYRKISGDAFLNEETGILLTDAAPRNVRIIEGAIILFDALAELATDRVIQWATAHRP